MAVTIERLKAYVQEHEQGQKLTKTADDLSDSDEDKEDEGMYEQDFGREF